MPITVISTSGSVVHIRPLPSDSTTQIVPVSAAAKFAPEIATRARRNASRRWSRAASASSAGSSESFGQAEASRKRSRISARFLWIAGTRRCDGRSPASWMISSARSVSIGRIAGRLERLVEPDLVGRERLHLHDLVGTLRPARGRPRSRSPPLRRAPSARSHRPPAQTPRARRAPFEPASASSLIAAAAARRRSQSATSATTAAALLPDRGRGVADVRPHLRVRRAPPLPLAGRPPAAHPRRSGAHDARISARCTGRTSTTTAVEPTTDLHQA